MLQTMTSNRKIKVKKKQDVAAEREAEIADDERLMHSLLCVLYRKNPARAKQIIKRLAAEEKEANVNPVDTRAESV
jgi:hypothetical protein